MIKSYKDELIKSMNWLAKKDDTIFLGQSVNYSGNAIYNTLEHVPFDKKIELPVFEDVQLGMSTGLALEGFVTISCFPRFDFLVLALNQLVNHLDKIKFMSKGKMIPKVIVRTSIGPKKPLDGGVQHTQNHSSAFKLLLKNMNVIILKDKEMIFQCFKNAYERKDGISSLIIEYGDRYND
tara:strand:+ start:127 stop:666 length:540 start_codon:yes stop_codon:yes gene_type:complete